VFLFLPDPDSLACRARPLAGRHRSLSQSHARNDSDSLFARPQPASRRAPPSEQAYRVDCLLGLFFPLLAPREGQALGASKYLTGFPNPATVAGSTQREGSVFHVSFDWPGFRPGRRRGFTDRRLVCSSVGKWSISRRSMSLTCRGREEIKERQ
jgi:hypothetical protein